MDKEQLYRYFEGTASPEEGQQVRQWMEAADEHRQEFFRERRLFDALLMAADEEPVGERSSWPWRIGSPLLKVVAVALLTLAIQQLYSVYVPSEPERQTVIAVPGGQRTHVTLPDGTGVWLNARSELRYSTSYNKEHREVHLQGEGFFEVAKEAARPFVVHTQAFSVEATGTRFNVEAYPGLSDFETALLEGGVKVSALQAPDKELHLQPGQRAYWEDGQLKVARLEHLEDYRWREGLICFRNETFEGILRQFRKSFGIRIRIHNDEVRKYTYTGKFRQADGVDYALRVLQRDIRFRYEKNDETETIDIY